MSTPFDENPDTKTLLADGGPESAAVDFELTPDMPGNEAEGVAVQRRETLEATDEVDGLGDKDGVAPESTTLNDAGEPAAPACSADAADRADEGTPAAETTNADGQPASDTSPGDDTPGTSSGEGGAAADDALARPPILNVGVGELVPKERYAGTVDRNKFASCWFGTYGDADQSVVKARLEEQGQHVAPLDEHGAHLGDPVHLSIAEESNVPIVYRVHRGLSDAEKREFVLSQQDGDRLRTPKQRRQLKHTRVLTLLDIRAGSDKRLTFVEIGRRVGYTEARVRQIYRKHQEPRDRNISDSKASEASATASNSGAPPKKPKEKKIPAAAPMAATAEPPARESPAIRTSRVTSRNPKSAQGPAAPLDLDFDTNELVDKALDRCGIKQDEKREWQAAGQRLLAERLKNCSDDHKDVLKGAAQASVEFRAAANAAKRRVEELLRTKAEEVA